MTQSVSKTLTALEKTTQMRNLRDQIYGNNKNSDDEEGAYQILDNCSPHRGKRDLHDDRLLETGHNRKRIQLGERMPIRGEESQVMSVDVTYQNPNMYEEGKGQNSRDW